MIIYASAIVIVQLVEYISDIYVNIRLGALASSGLITIGDAGQVQGGWHSWVKIITESGNEIRENGEGYYI